MGKRDPLFTWAEAKRLITKGLVELRERNDSVALDQDQTMYLRGQIAMAKEILEMDVPRPAAPEAPGYPPMMGVDFDRHRD